MDDILIVGRFQALKPIKFCLPPMHHPSPYFLNQSQVLTPDKIILPDNPNMSFTLENFDHTDSSKAKKKQLVKRHFTAFKEIPTTFSPDFELKGRVTQTHVRKLKPIVQISVQIETKTKRKPLALNSKVSPKDSIKKELFVYWGEMLRSLNGVEVVPIISGNYKYYIGKGNNANLINHILKRRFWWTRVDEPELANLVWTQLKQRTDKVNSTENNENIQKPLKRLPKSLINQAQALGLTLIKDTNFFIQKFSSLVLQSENHISYNRLANNSQICNKKSLFKNLKKYYISINQDPFTKIPLTFHIENKASESVIKEFCSQFKEGSLWIIKPGECTNRGNGIHVSNNLSEIKGIISNTNANHSYIIQKYIENPLLINKRKFDIRCYALLTSVNGNLLAYFYKEGYLRTASKEFSLKSAQDRFIHLTNDAVQKHSEDYGKFEAGNKLSYIDFQRYLASNHPDKDFTRDIYNQIVSEVKDSVSSAKDFLISDQKSIDFEVLGYDFMVDADFNVWLIEVNTNPCLELGCAYLSKLIPEMLENAFKVAIDPIFPPHLEHKKFKRWVEDSNFVNRFELIFNSNIN